MSSVKKRRRLKKSIFVYLLILIVIIVALLLLFKKGGSVDTLTDMFVSSNTTSATLYDLEFNESISINRGTIVKAYDTKEKKDDKVYIKIKYNDEYYLIDENNLVEDKNNVVKEKEMFVRTNLTVYKDSSSSKILSYIKKGERLEILGFNSIDESGRVNRYKIKYGDTEGYVYGKYLVNTKEEADKVYDQNGLQEYLAKMGNSLNGGTASELDYYPYEKPKFENNKMPDEVRALYINSAAVRNIDKYI